MVDKDICRRILTLLNEAKSQGGVGAIELDDLARKLKAPPDRIRKNVEYLADPGKKLVKVEPMPTPGGRVLDFVLITVAGSDYITEPKVRSYGVGVAKEDYLDFDLLIEGSEAGYRARVLNSPAGETKGDFCLPLTPEQLAEAFWRLESGETDRDFLQDLGSDLFAALFRADIGSRFRSSQGMAQPNKGLRLRLRLESGDLFTLPWELLYDPDQQNFLSLTRRTPVVRHLPVPHPAVSQPVSPPLRMLVVPANPRDMVQLGVQREVCDLQRAVQPLVDEGLLAVEILHPPTARALWERLVSHPYHILHFIGHGGFDGRHGYIALEDRDGLAHRLDGQQVVSLFSDTPVRMAVLSACLTAREGAREKPDALQQAYLGVAPALVQAGLLAVIGMQFSLSDKGARIFAQAFYQMLARHKPVDEAVDEARTAMMSELGLECRDWVAPVLFLRGSTGEIFPER